MKSARKLMQRRAQRVRRRLKKHSGGCARLSVFRSSKNISVQIIDDATGTTLASASTLEDKKAKGSDIAAAERIGKLIGVFMETLGNLAVARIFAHRHIGCCHHGWNAD